MQGDESAFLELIQRYKKVSYHFIVKYKSYLEEFYDFNDLKQIALITLYQAVLTYNEEMECSFSTYYGILLDRDFCMCIRKLSRNGMRSNFNAIRLDDCVYEADNLYLVDLVKNERVDYDPKMNMDLIVYESMVDKELKSLNTSERQIFEMWRDGYRYNEISSLLKIDKKKIDNTIQKVKKILKGRLTM